MSKINDLDFVAYLIYKRYCYRNKCDVIPFDIFKYMKSKAIFYKKAIIVQRTNKIARIKKRNEKA